MHDTVVRPARTVKPISSPPTTEQAAAPTRSTRVGQFGDRQLGVRQVVSDNARLIETQRSNDSHSQAGCHRAPLAPHLSSGTLRHRSPAVVGQRCSRTRTRENGVSRLRVFLLRHRLLWHRLLGSLSTAVSGRRRWNAFD
jgi:hypothetical protein